MHPSIRCHCNWGVCCVLSLRALEALNFSAWFKIIFVITAVLFSLLSPRFYALDPIQCLMAEERIKRLFKFRRLNGIIVAEKKRAHFSNDVFTFFWNRNRVNESQCTANSMQCNAMEQKLKCETRNRRIISFTMSFTGKLKRNKGETIHIFTWYKYGIVSWYRWEISVVSMWSCLCLTLQAPKHLRNFPFFLSRQFEGNKTCSVLATKTAHN